MYFSFLVSVLLVCGAAQAAVIPLQKLLIQQIDNLSSPKMDLAAQGFRLISTSQDNAAWMSEEQILGLRRKEIGFMDVTDQDLEKLQTFALPKRFAPPAKVSHKSIVTPLLANISIPHMTEFLSHFSTFKTRYYQTATGAQSVEWLYQQIAAIQPVNGDKVAVKLSKFYHDWGQFSIIARVENVENPGRGSAEPAVVIGAHIDSANGANPYFGRSPGADDDGSGTTTILEAFRVLLGSGFTPSRPIEFHWYSAEEAGLLGSQKVAAQYKSDGRQIAGMYQCDMTGYVPKGRDPVVAIVTDFVDPDLTDFLRKVATAYSSVKVVDTQCGYACSDHASWSKAGYASTFGFETEFKDHSPFIHTSEDTVENLDFHHIAHFTRVALGFAVELSLAREEEL
ncbi:Leucine aminopeptidase 1 [Chytriomyces hyalinus]|nr:Leucine aminopeptidase 1 [Chytriomyces hyalinus]